MKKITLFLGLVLMACTTLFAQAPANCPDVMLQGFHWDSYGGGKMDKSYARTKWTDLAKEVDDIAETFTMVWLPPSAKSSGGTGYHPKEWSNQNSDWGSAAELKTLINAFHAKNCKVIADIVINHRDGNYKWGDFCNENFGTYGNFQDFYSKSAQLICSDDEIRHEADQIKPTGAKDAGYEYVCDASGGYCASRDLDHSNTYLQGVIKAYLKWMKNEMGYDGWRYDLVKGYLGKYTKIYNEAAGAYYSVGEYWDRYYDGVKNWVNETGKTSTAFDFPNKYATFNNALASKNFGAMINGYKVPNGLCGADEMKRYATTFIDNHDTFRDGNKYGGDWTIANAVLLAQPGIPCVFWPHWEKCKADIKKMVAARKAAGVHSQSACTTAGGGSYYQSTTVGTKGTLICFIGSGWSAPAGYTKACGGTSQGTEWAYYTNVTVPTGPTVTMNPTGGYVGVNGKVTLTASKGTIYYTTNGTTPSASSTKYTGPITITTNNTTIKAIAIDGSNKSSVVSGTFLTEKPAGLTVEFKAPAGWGSVNLYVWDANETPILGEWPGKAITKNGDYYTYTITETDTRPLNVIFNDGTNQTADITGVSTSTCWDGTKSSGKDAKGNIIPGSCGSDPAPDPTPDPDPTPGPTPDPTLPTDGYGIVVNGTDNYPATYMGKAAHSDHEEYKVSVPLKAGDTFVTYDYKNKAGWVMAIETGGESTKFTAGTQSVTCNTAGCYDFYIKMMYQNDIMYIAAGTECGTPTPTPDPTPDPDPTPTPDPTPGLSTDYYLIGYIDGADYGSGDDWNNLGDYRFVNGKVTVTFNETSYIYIKTGDLSGCYMVAEYVLPNEAGATATLEKTTFGDGIKWEKVGVPAGTATFTLKENSDGTLTLSYTMGGQTTSIEDALAESTTIYPNPTTGKAVIASNKEVSNVVVRNLIGKTVASFSSNLLDLSNLAASMYLVEIQFADGESMVQKVIKK